MRGGNGLGRNRDDPFLRRVTFRLTYLSTDWDRGGVRVRYDKWDSLFFLFTTVVRLLGLVTGVKGYI